MSTRETASAFWLLVLLLFVLRNQTLREGVGAVLKVIFRGPIRRWSLFLCVYTGILSYALCQIGLWHLGDLKATLLWLPTVGLYMLYQSGFEQPGPRELIGRIFREGFNLAVLLEFLISSFTFPILVELCLVPVAALLGFMTSSRESEDPRTRLAVRFSDNALTVIGIGLLGHALFQTAVHWQEVWQRPTALALILPILLSILTIPFLWSLQTYMAYQVAFLRLRVLFNEFPLPRCFKLRLIWTFGIRYHEVRQWWRYCIASRPGTPDALKRSLTESRDYRPATD